MAISLPPSQLEPFVVHNVRPTGRQLGAGSYDTLEEVDINGTICVAKKIHDILLEVGSPGEVRGIFGRFVQECQLMSSLQHPNIIQFIGVSSSPQSRAPALLMEKMSISLQGLLERYPNIPVALKRSILHDVTRGLTYLHNRLPPIMHRDLSASNVLLNSALVAKLSDFGVARILDISPGRLAAEMTQIPGTLVYMPPEALAPGLKYDTKIDIFSLGNVAMFTLTQLFPELLEPTYYGPQGLLLARSEIERRIRYIQLIREQLGRQHPLVQLVEQCLHNDPQRRPPATEVLQLLEQAKALIPEQDAGEMTKLEMMRALQERERRIQQQQMEHQQQFQTQEQQHQDRIKLLEEKIQSLSDQLEGGKELKLLQEELSTAQKELSAVEGECRVQKAANESLQKQLVESEWRAQEVERESQQAKQESQHANQQLQILQGKRNELTAVVELRDKQLDWERKALDEHKVAKRQLQSAVVRQEKELECLREELENVQCLDKQSAHNHDPTYPGVCFFGDPLQESVDSNGRLIQWPQVGVELDIPPGAVPSGEVLYLSIWPCLSGPYVLPPGWELASPVYLIKTSKFNFKKPVKLSLTHYARLSTDEDCNEMAFVSARFSFEITNKHPGYRFKILRNQGVFKKGESVGTTYITHFCGSAVARKQKQKQENDLESSILQDVEYSLLLYHNKSIPYKRDGYAVFAVSFCHPLYLENLDQDIKEQFHGIQFWRSQKHRVEMTRDAVEVEYPQAVGRWRIEPDRKPLRISLKEVDLPIYHPELSRSKEHYPPRILLTITSPQEAEESNCALRVFGVSEPVEFLMQLKREKQPKRRDREASPLSSLNTLGERPALRMLLAFPARNAKLCIPKEIGVLYTEFGIFLLEDDTGTKIEALENQYNDNTMRINIEILKEWIRGRGKQPVIWRTLVEVLREIGLNGLADSIAAVKC